MAIHATAIVDSAAQIEPTAEIGPYVVIEGQVRIGAHCRISPFVHVSGHTEIGSHCRIHSGASIGDTPQDTAYKDCESYTRIGSGTTIREGVTIHRGTLPGSMTSVGARCLLMCNSHVGHNCQLGDGVTLVNGALLGGLVEVGNHCIISGNAAVHQQVRIGELTIIGGLTKVVQDVPPYMTYTQERGCSGINAVGLRRKEMSAAERADARLAFRTLYREGLSLQDAIARLEQIVETRAGRMILEFVRVPSIRGLTSARERSGRA